MDTATQIAYASWELVCLLRMLMCNSPRDAEEMHDGLYLLEQHRIKELVPIGSWIKTTHGYMWSDGMEGRWQPTLPHGVAESEVIHLPRDAEPHRLRDRLEQLAAEMERIAPPEIASSFQDSVARVEFWHQSETQQAFFATFGETGLARLGTPEEARRFLNEFVERQLLARRDGLIDGSTCSLVLVVVALIQAFQRQPSGAIGPGFLEYYRSTMLRPFDFMGVYGQLMQGIRHDVRLAISSLIERAITAGHVGAIVEEARRLKGLGQQALEAALNAGELDLFYQLLFHAFSFFNAALFLFHLLARSPNLTDENFREELRQEAVKGCEERLVRIVGSLHNALVDLWTNNSTFQTCRAAIGSAQQSGRLAVEKKLTEFIELRYLYPRFFRKVLLTEPSG